MTAIYEAKVRAAALRASGGRQIVGPVGAELVLVFARPKSMRAKKYPRGRLTHDRRPDADNVAKSVLDGMGDVVEDDSRIAELKVVKVYAAIGESPHVEVRLWALGEVA